MSVPDVPKSLVWYKDSLCVGLRSQYMLVKMAQNQGRRRRKLSSMPKSGFQKN